MTAGFAPPAANLDELPAGTGTGRTIRRGQVGHRIRQVGIVLIAVLAAGSTGRAPLVALVVVAVLAAVLIAARPDAAALVAVGILYSNAVVVAVHHHGVPGAAAALVPMLLLVTISYRTFALRQPLLLPRAGIWVIGLFVAQLLGAVSSRDPATSVASLQTFLLEGLVLFALLTNALRGAQMLRAAAVVLMVTAALLGLASAVQDAVGGTLGGFATTSKAVVNKDQDGGSKRHAGPIGEQNRWAQSLAVVLPVALALATSDRERSIRLLGKLCCGGILVGIVLTYSRGAVVGLALTGLIAVAARWVRVKVAVTVVVVAVIGLAAFAPVFVGRASTVVDAGSSVSKADDRNAQVDGSVANRTTEATAAFSVFSRHPAVGVGVGLFPTYFQDEARRQGADRIVGVNREAHDLYLGIAAEMGLAGLITFAGLIVALITPLAAVRRRELAERRDVAMLATGLALGVVTYLTTGLFLHFAYIRYFWLLASLAAAMGMVEATDGSRIGGSRAPTVARAAEVAR
ncbi:hypothetical protein BH10ACT1_BH10ACT1_36130 [soil metagenome]